jgi:hypothetical protein
MTHVFEQQDKERKQKKKKKKSWTHTSQEPEACG